MPENKQLSLKNVFLKAQIEKSSTQLQSSITQLPLSALLSQVLVAFTIEFDNEFEHQMPHRTTNHGVTGDLRHAPWLVSMAMYLNCMQFVTPDGIGLAELRRLARTETNLAGMQRWGYIKIEPMSSGSAVKPRPDALIRTTYAGQKAQEIWQALFGLIEARWQERFAADTILRLKESLSTLANQFDLALPDCLPILGYGLTSRETDYPQHTRLANSSDNSVFSLPILLSKVLLKFALEFENLADLSLAISANVLRILNIEGVRLQELPVLSGVSKEAITMAVNFLQKKDFIEIASDAVASRTKLVRLTPKGLQAQTKYNELVAKIEEQWQQQFGIENIEKLRELLESLIGSSTSCPSPLLEGLQPYPDGWRAAVRQSTVLPHYPMVLHRGGFPDGS